MKKKKKLILIAFLSCVIAAVLVFSAAALVIVAYSTTDQTCHCDAVIVLGAGISGSEPSPVFRERLNHGVYLYQNGYADVLILTGGIGEGKTESEASVAKRYVISCGVPESAILTEEASVITEQNLRNAKVLMDEHSLETALIVSDPLHMKRAMLMAGDFGIDAYSSPTPTSMYRSLRTKLPFLARETFFYVGYYVLRPFR